MAVWEKGFATLVAQCLNGDERLDGGGEGIPLQCMFCYTLTRKKRPLTGSREGTGLCYAVAEMRPAFLVVGCNKCCPKL